VQGSGSETNMWVCINQNSCDVTRAGFKGLASSIYATVLATMDGEEYRTESADSENGSDNSYVQVTQEEAQQLGSQEQPPAAPQSEPYTAKIPAVDNEEDM